MHNETRNFDTAAATWDEKPQRVKLAGDIGNAIIGEVPINDSMNALDFGCGTGLLTLQLQPLVRTIIGADSSRAMLEILNGKIAAAGLDNICSMELDQEQVDTLKGKYDLIVSSMTLHHVKEIDPLFAAFHAAMVPGGIVCLADLDLDRGRFHDDNTGVFHQGFDRAALRAALNKAGFVDVRDLTAAEIVKQRDDGATETFSVFLMTARKKQPVSHGPSGPEQTSCS
jgi:predicted TPR repeat methyltransferase